MSIEQKALKGVLWSGIQNWGGQFGSLIVLFVLARLLQPEDFGLVALANSFLAFAQIFLEQGFSQAIIQREDLEAEHLDTAFWTNLAIGCMLAIVSLLTAGWIADGFKQSELTPILRCFSLLFVIRSLSSTQQAILERHFAFRAIAVRWLIGVLVGGAIGIAMALAGFGAWSLVVQQLVQESIGVLVLWKASHWRPRLRFSPTHLRHLFGFGVNILILNFLNYFNNRINDFLIGYFLGPIALGYYTIAYRILQAATQLLVRTSSAVSLPTFSRLASDPERLKGAFYKATRLTSAVALPAFMGMAVLAPELIEILFGKQWLPSTPLLQILVVAGIFRSVTFFKNAVFMAMGKPTWTVWFNLLSVSLNLIGFAIAIPWGMIAVTLAFTIRFPINFLISQSAISRLTGIPLLPYLRQFLTPTICSLTMAVLLWVSRSYFVAIFDRKIYILAVLAMIGALLYVLLIRVFAKKLFDELLNIFKLYKSEVKRTKPS
ncbi:MAG: lipopolysaccharide biosynthesis protein [Leptolyngbya sp. SIO1E4]|nr:lipopolysaccharide biosynthesis protein [Leptolyngbya sp. SIO1E4]